MVDEAPVVFTKNGMICDWEQKREQFLPITTGRQINVDDCLIDRVDDDYIDDDKSGSGSGNGNRRRSGID